MSLQKAEAHLEHKQTNFQQWTFLWIYLTAYYFRNKSAIIDVQLVYI